MAEKPPEEGYISVVDEEPEIFDLLWVPTHSQKAQEPRPVEKSVPEKKQQKQEADPFDLDEPTFIERYRLTKDLTRNLCQELKPVMPDSTKSIEFSVESKVLATLAFYATGKYQKTAGIKMDPSITQYFMCTAVSQVTEALNHPSIVKKYIHFPHLKTERANIRSRFYMKNGIHNVIGCVDCMHVPIARPDDDQKVHFNKSYHSKKAQIICDSEQMIISVDATAGGSLSHDAILKRHAVRVDLESLNNAGEQCWLIGGLYYTQRKHLMTPIPKVTKKSPVSPEKYYNTIITQTHSAVTDIIKQLKSRWKCLQATCNKQFDPTTVAQIIVACCVLNNICNRRGLTVVAMTQTEERLEAMKQKVANGPVPRKQQQDQAGIEMRTRLMEQLWEDRRVNPDCSAPKKRASKKDKVIENHQVPQQPMPQPVSQPPPPPLQPQLQTHHQPHMMHEDMSKRPRLVTMTTPTYGINGPLVWGHYPQH